MVVTGSAAWKHERATLALVALAALSTLFMLQSIRVFVAYLVFVVDQSNRAALGGIAIGVFAAIGLGGLVFRALGPSRAVLATAGLLGASRLVLQFCQQPEARVALGALGVMAWGWLLVALLRLSRDGAATGLVLGLGLDIAVRVGFRTVDLPWMPGAAAHALTLLLLAGLALAGWEVVRNAARFPAAPASAASLVAIGPGLAVYHLMAGNPGMARSMLDIGFTQAGVLLAIGALLGAGVAALDDGRALASGARVNGPLGLIAIAALAIGAVVILWQRPYPTSLAFVAGVVGTFVLLSMATRGGEPGRLLSERGVTAWLTAGMLLHGALLFAYYTFTGPPELIVAAWALFALGALATGSNVERASLRPALVAAPVAALALALVVGLTTRAFEEDAPEAGAPLPAEFTVLTYNLQAGFDIDNWWSLEAQARTIEAQDPDVVVLQEVGRGWLVLSPVDEVEWLSRRLDMPYVFGANSDDGLWGNAILSRAPMSDVDRHQFATTDNLKRGVISAQVATETGGVWVFGTHLDNPAEAGEVRLQQVEELISVIGGRVPAVLAGDFNAEPDSDVLAALAEAGMADPALAINLPDTTSSDNTRIDYVLTSADLTTVDIYVPAIWTSDHLPVVARVRVGE